MKNIQLNIDRAKQLFGKNPELDELLRENFSEEELGIKKRLPTCYNDLNEIDGYYISPNALLQRVCHVNTNKSSTNIFNTEKQALSALAYAQLTQLMKVYNGNWIPDWSNDHMQKHVIERNIDDLEISCYYNSHNFLAFPIEEIAIEFLFNFKDLIKIYYQI